MANALVNAFRQDLVGADIDLLADTIILVLVDSSYVFDAAHDNLNDVGAGSRIATSGALANKTGTNGYFDSDPVVFSSVAGGDTVAGFWMCKSSGVESTSRLICWYDTNAASAAISTPTNGANITASPNASGWFRV